MHIILGWSCNFETNLLHSWPLAIWLLTFYCRIINSMMGHQPHDCDWARCPSTHKISSTLSHCRPFALRYFSSNLTIIFLSYSLTVGLCIKVYNINHEQYKLVSPHNQLLHPSHSLILFLYVLISLVLDLPGCTNTFLATWCMWSLCMWNFQSLHFCCSLTGLVPLLSRAMFPSTVLALKLRYSLTLYIYMFTDTSSVSFFAFARCHHVPIRLAFKLPQWPGGL